MARATEAFAKLKALGEDRVAQIDEMLTRGLPAKQVASFVQNEWGVWKDDRLDSIKKMLERYRKSDLRTRILKGIAGVNEGLRASTLQKRLNALDEMAELVAHQKARYLKVLEREKPTPLLMKQVTDEGRLLKEILVEFGRLQLETGQLQRAPKKISGSVTDPGGETRTFEWREEQEALLAEIEQEAARELAEG